ncbi:DUF5060 domain-containing protein [Seonamhaeicola maritimus]|uniref:DUF5060 domain-containing protein n=1 Tax=Seonamhaeicola maritimus TaxID=2591822 RepID=UPI0019D593EB|nr:DUF5060 domain-containing protein [Seonamhaeicola maritimus]
MQKLSFLLGILLLTCSSVNAQKIEGALKKWHKITLSFEGDQLSESDENNPFLNYRLNVIFKNKNKTMIVPGFFAADGNAGETSAKSGNIWKVRFMPDEVGEWSYEVSFRKGENIAVNDDIHAGEAVAFDGAKGKFIIGESDNDGSAFRTKGRLKYTGDRYLRYADSKEAFLKGGADSPESFLGYYEFDQTPASHKYEAHASDWKEGNPTWQNGKGKNIIGALNYLASEGMNSVYFLTMNVQGDGKDVWPWTNRHERYRFDCSKLDQWEVVFDYMDDLGLMLHIVTQETENELLLDIGETKTQRKLYYRELIARFSHHLAITWNLGEENGPLHWTPKGQTDKDRKAMAKYIKTHDPYQNFVVLHTHASTPAQDLFLTPLLGYEYLDGPSMQTHYPVNVHDITVKWINESGKFGKQWVVCQDEIGPASTGAKPDADDPEHNDIRAEVLWGNLMAGGAGVEWYFGYKFAHHDLTCEDWRSRNNVWDQTRFALEFFNNYLPFETMTSNDGLTKNEHDYVYAKKGSIYAVYLPKIEETKLDLSGIKAKFSVKWYNPRTGGALLTGSTKTIKGGGLVSIGTPPSAEGDWVALIQNKSKKKVVATPNNSITINAIGDFEIDKTSEAIYYKEEKRGTFAINAGNKSQRDKFASASSIFKGETGYYSGELNTMAENDGESTYFITVNKQKMKFLKNPQTPESFKNTSLAVGKLYLKKGDTIKIASKALTNGKIPEADETAWSRGRWKSLRLTPVIFDLNEKLEDVEAFEEKNGLLAVEGEAFHYNSNNGSPRKFYVHEKGGKFPFTSHDDHLKGASGDAYIEAMPDTRKTHDDKLIVGENFFPVPGIGGMVSYKVKINTPGTYYVWVRAYSTGPEDNGLHVGVNGEWPESGQRIQLCKGKHNWTWSSAQRVPENHCGYAQTITLTFDKADEYIVSFSMREDGFELDKWMLVKDKSYIPE